MYFEVCFDDLMTTCDERPFLVKVLSDAVEARQVDDSQAKTFYGWHEVDFLHFRFLGSTYEDACREVEKNDVWCKS